MRAILFILPILFGVLVFYVGHLIGQRAGTKQAIEARKERDALQLLVDRVRVLAAEHEDLPGEALPHHVLHEINIYENRKQLP